MLGQSRRDFEAEPGSIPVGAIVESRTAWAEAAAEEFALYFCELIPARHLVGISVGIGSNRRQKILQLQLVMVLGDCRPGAPTGHPPSSSSVHFIQ
jgi:hypothetical protein